MSDDSPFIIPELLNAQTMTGFARCPTCNCEFRQTTPLHVFCTRKCKRKGEYARKKARDEATLTYQDPEMNVIRNATAADIQRHAQIVLLEPGRVFHYAADFPFDKVKIPAKVSLELLMYKKNVPVWVLMEADFPSLMQGKWTEESEVDLKVEPRITQEIAVSQAVARVNPKM